MPFTVTMPKLSPTMEAGTLVKWKVQVGDHVTMGSTLFEVTTDKATVEHSALDEGYLRKILVSEGQTAVVNQPLAIFTETKEESIEGYVPEGFTPAAKAPPKEEKQEEKAPKPTMTEAVGLPLPAFVPEPPLEQYDLNIPTGTPSERIIASPLAKKLASEKKIDLTSVKGTGPRGRVVSRDLDLGQPKQLVNFGRCERPTIAPGSYEELSLSPMRKVIAKRLQESKTFIPHFYVTQIIRAETMIQIREQLKSVGVNISFNDIVVRAAALALREAPVINSGFNSVNGTIIQFKTIDIAIAVSLPEGLITPILRHADYKNLGQISLEIKQLAKRARDGKLAREEYVGGSFTISNLGMFGITEFVGVINPPQAALLAIGGIEERPVVEDGKVIAGKTMHITLSADHRVIDGADAAKFLKELQRLLENAACLLI